MALSAYFRSNRVNWKAGKKLRIVFLFLASTDLKLIQCSEYVAVIFMEKKPHHVYIQGSFVFWPWMKWNCWYFVDFLESKSTFISAEAMIALANDVEFVAKYFPQLFKERHWVIPIRKHTLVCVYGFRKFWFSHCNIQFRNEQNTHTIFNGWDLKRNDVTNAFE